MSTIMIDNNFQLTRRYTSIPFNFFLLTGYTEANPAELLLEYFIYLTGRPHSLRSRPALTGHLPKTPPASSIGLASDHQ
jgi:hypothetical protein